jgi:hypothetical protein
MRLVHLRKVLNFLLIAYSTTTFFRTLSNEII